MAWMLMLTLTLILTLTGLSRCLSKVACKAFRRLERAGLTVRVTHGSAYSAASCLTVPFWRLRLQHFGDLLTGPALVDAH